MCYQGSLWGGRRTTIYPFSENKLTRLLLNNEFIWTFFIGLTNVCYQDTFNDVSHTSDAIISLKLKKGGIFFKNSEHIRTSKCVTGRSGSTINQVAAYNFNRAAPSAQDWSECQTVKWPTWVKTYANPDFWPHFSSPPFADNQFVYYVYRIFT